MPLPKSFSDNRVRIIGLGYVGLTLAVGMADAGFHVHGVEVRDDVIRKLQKGEPHFWEPRLREKLARVIGRGTFTFSKTLDSSAKATVYIITVGTPLDKNGKVRLDMAEHAAREVAADMPNGALVILRSTVKLGTARKVVNPILAASGKSFQLAVCPERTLEGIALIELHELPQVIGADDPDTRWRCQQLFGQITATTVSVSSLETAELIKLVDNTFRDLSFGFANEIAKLCGRAGISASEAIRAANISYPRTTVARPGPVGGPCLEKDPHILVESAGQWGVDLPITLSSRRTNEEQPADVASITKIWASRLPSFPERPTVSLLGLAFKGMPPTDDLRGTMALPIFRAIRAQFPGAVFRAFDPVVKPAAAEALFGFKTVSALPAAFDGADLVMVLNNHPSFQEMDLAALAGAMHRPGIIYDLWNMHNDLADSMPKGIVALSLGSERV